MSLIMPFDQWPEADQVMWDTLMAPGGPLDDHGALAHLRATTRQFLASHYGRWLGWISAHHAHLLGQEPVSRASIGRLQEWLVDLQHTQPTSQAIFLDSVLRVLSSFSPDHDWKMQCRLVAALKHAAGRGDPERKRGRILSSKVLLDLGLHHAGPYADAAATPLEQMKRRRDGTMIALLALLPMRLRAFCELEIGYSVHLMEDQILIALSEEMTKTGVAWEASVPRQVEPALRRYIEEVRPFLMARGSQNHDSLWVGGRGTIVGKSYLAKRIGDITRLHTGKRVSPHLFRDAAATTLARVSPEAARLIPPVLAHSGFKTAERHYIHAQTIDAGREYAALIRSMKGGRR